MVGAAVSPNFMSKVSVPAFTVYPALSWFTVVNKLVVVAVLPGCTVAELSANPNFFCHANISSSFIRLVAFVFAFPFTVFCNVVNVLLVVKSIFLTSIFVVPLVILVTFVSNFVKSDLSALLFTFVLNASAKPTVTVGFPFSPVRDITVSSFVPAKVSLFVSFPFPNVKFLLSVPTAMLNPVDTLVRTGNGVVCPCSPVPCPLGSPDPGVPSPFICLIRSPAMYLTNLSLFIA